MKIEVLMSMMNGTNIKALNLKKRNILGDCYIVNQVKEEISLKKDKTITMESFKERGVAKSRNRLIEGASGDAGIITDDDITFVKDYKKLIEKMYKENPNADIITFNTKRGNEILGSKRGKKHNFLSIMSVISFQISFKIKSIRNAGIKFDERFGLGSTYKAGEENIFLNDCRKKGLNIIHVPIIINEHPVEETTGEIWDDNQVKTKGALCYRLLGNLNFFFFIYFLLFKYKFYRKKMNVFGFIKNYNLGVKDFKVNYKKN